MLGHLKCISRTDRTHPVPGRWPVRSGGVPTNRRKRGLTPGIILLVIAAAVVTYLVIQRAKPILTGSGCQAGTGGTAISLDTEQARIAATIAGVAYQRSMPPRAVVVAYAAAMQESKLHNLAYGDRDSVGVFQQRPSEGWGPASKLKNPVYATTRFFQALDAVPDYRHKPVYRAAQAVQHSADGYAYLQYQQEATSLATAFTGHSAHAVWCWSAGPGPAKANVMAARRALAASFGPVGAHRLATHGDAPTLLVRAPQPTLGWAVAAWLVTHAARYGIHDVHYGRFGWRASAGDRGWTRDKSAAHPGEVRAS